MSVSRFAGLSAFLLEMRVSADYLYVSETEVIHTQPQGQDDLYAIVAAEYGAALERLARAYEAEPERRRDLLQDIHLQLWRSMAHFNKRCSMRTWMYRVAHNTATTHVLRERRALSRLVS